MLERHSDSKDQRSEVLKDITALHAMEVPKPSISDTKPVSEYFGELTLGLSYLKQKLPEASFLNILHALERGERINIQTANHTASVIKDWALSKGANHYCHWFQPMTGFTAEKHDAFVSVDKSFYSEQKVIEKFTGSQLILGEPDASSFPSGGMRSTFEARGYTAWDPSSPIFIMEGEKSKTLCIPSVFIGYHGEALDFKTPLLRSMDALSDTVTEFLKEIGDQETSRVIATLGVEQEYFLIDRRYLSQRPDILMTGRTLLGAPPARGQQMEDHYFGSIPMRIQTFMESLERELYRLGIPIKTRHNEVAPSQYEIAPIFESATIGSDHNTLLMEVIKKIANYHGLYCLLHEKPFAGLNGSGKHCNWSICNDKGENLLEPGKTPHQNIRFLAIVSIILNAVYEHADILRASVSSAGNDHRLGANEAPPAIVSVFCGSLLSKIFQNIENGLAADGTDQQIIDLGVNQIPLINKDYTDRNRTSPFAFTGNKFEFRAVGSSANVADPISILNAGVADSFLKARLRLKELQKKLNSEEAIMELIRELLKSSKKIRFDGNGYSKEWVLEAKKRNLPILSTSYEALEVLNDKKATNFLIEQKVMSSNEIQSHYHIQVETYVKKIEIEFIMMSEMIETLVIPALEKQIIQSQNVLKEASSRLRKTLKTRVTEFEDLLNSLIKENLKMTEFLRKTKSISNEEKIRAIHKEGLFIAKKIRELSDSAEQVTSDDLWPLPKYREMLFTHPIS